MRWRTQPEPVETPSTPAPVKPPARIPDERLATAVDVVVEGFEEVIRKFGQVLPPVVAMFDDRRSLPYCGSIICREFQRGADCIRAVGGMGVGAALLGVPRLVISWEHADLCRAEGLPGAPFPSGLVVVEAEPARQRAYWQSLHISAGRGEDVLTPRWGEPVAMPADVALPHSIEYLLAMWRADRDEDPDEILSAMIEAGYQVCLSAHF